MDGKREPLVLIFDVGTQSTRAFLFNKRGEIVRKAKVDNHMFYSTQPLFAEKDAEEYIDEIARACAKLKEESGEYWDDIIAVSVTALRNCQLCLDRELRPLRPVITWMDQRNSEYEPKNIPLVNRFLYKLVGMDDAARAQYESSFSSWIKQNQPEVWQNTYKFVFISAYINYRFCGRLADSKAGVVGRIPYDYKKRDWMKKSHLNYPVFNCDVEKMCEVVEPCEVMGYITRECAERMGIKEGVPYVSAGSDKACETLGVGCVGDDVASLSFGTAATVNMITEKFIAPEMFMPSYTAVVPGHYSPEIQIFRGFWMITWFKQQFFAHEAKVAQKLGISPEAALDNMLDNVPVGSQGLILQPYWAPGLKIPKAKGTVIGFSDIHTKAHVYRAIVEGIGYALYDGLLNIEKNGKISVKRIAVSGGGSQSDAICRIAADLFGKEIYRVQTYETSGLGAAITAFTAMKEFGNTAEAIGAMVRVSDRFEPNMVNHAKYDDIYGKIYSKLYRNVKKLYDKLYDIAK